jgi:hypothetical protein
VKFLRLEEFIDDVRHGMALQLEPQGLLFAEVNRSNTTVSQSMRNYFWKLGRWIRIREKTGFWESQNSGALEAVLWNRNHRNRIFLTSGTGTVINYGSGNRTRYNIKYLISFI